MSFREVKSMLRMLNIDMDDVYASKLFKVPVLHRLLCPLLSPGGNCWLLLCLPQHRELTNSSPKPPTATGCWVPPGAHGGEG